MGKGSNGRRSRFGELDISDVASGVAETYANLSDTSRSYPRFSLLAAVNVAKMFVYRL